MYLAVRGLGDAAYAAAVEHKEQPTVILAKTIKGCTLGNHFEGRNATHQMKKLTLEDLKGFRDTLEIARGNRPDFFNLAYAKPAPFVPRHLRAELPGRMDYHGRELAPLDLSGLPAILDGFKNLLAAAVETTFVFSEFDGAATIKNIKEGKVRALGVAAGLEPVDDAAQGEVADVELDDRLGSVVVDQIGRAHV